MQTIRKYAHGRWYECKPASNGVWYIHWSEDRRSKRQTTRQKDLGAAQAFFDEWLGLVGAERAEAPTTAELWALKYPVESERQRHAWAKLGPHFGHLRPGDVTQSVEDAYRAKRRVAPSTIRLELALLRAAWNHGVKRRLISSADLPVLNGLPAASPPRDRVLDDDEVERLLAAAQEHSLRVWAFLWLASETAARRTAIQELRWSQVDWEIGVIHYLRPGAVQTRKRKASVPISSRLRPVLETLQSQRRDEYVIGAGSRVNDAVTAVAMKAKVSRVTPHVLRHTAATRMVRAGVSLWVVAQILGNTVEQVEKVYAKWQPARHKEAIDMISGRRAA